VGDKLKTLARLLEKLPREVRVRRRQGIKGVGGDKVNNATLPVDKIEVKKADEHGKPTDKNDQEGKGRKTGGAAKPTPEEVELAKSSGSTPEHIAVRDKVARNYLENNGFTDGQISNALGSVEDGIDGGVDLCKPLEVVAFPPPDTMTQYVKSHGYPGNWFDPRSNQTPDSLGLNGSTRTLKAFKVPEGSGLQSYAKPVLDDWTVPEIPVETTGGGIQLLVNDSIKKSALGA
jgi:hypothetical protein